MKNRVGTCLMGFLGFLSTACGDDSGSGGGSTTTSTTGAGTTKSAATSSSSGSTANGTGSSSTSSGMGCCKIRDDDPNTCQGATCGSCVRAACGAELDACGNISTCNMAVEDTFVPCVCDAQVADDMSAEDACIAAVQGSGAEASAVYDCVQQNCAADCFL